MILKRGGLLRLSDLSKNWNCILLCLVYIMDSNALKEWRPIRMDKAILDCLDLNAMLYVWKGHQLDWPYLILMERILSSWFSSLFLLRKDGFLLCLSSVTISDLCILQLNLPWESNSLINLNFSLWVGLLDLTILQALNLFLCPALKVQSEVLLKELVPSRLEGKNVII